MMVNEPLNMTAKAEATVSRKAVPGLLTCMTRMASVSRRAVAALPSCLFMMNQAVSGSVKMTP